MTDRPVPVSRPRVLASTTSHKKEPLLETLDVFGRIGLCDVDLNLHHLLDVGVPVDAVREACAAHGLHLWMLSGGWCDFFHDAPDVERTFASVARQVDLAAHLAVDAIRLFFGRLELAHYTGATLAVIRANLLRLSDAHPRVTFVFENHDGASLRPEVCREILDAVDRPNVRMNFDPINFAKAGIDPLEALAVVLPRVGHVHLKGLDAGHYCEFGDGDVDLEPVIARLEAAGYRGRYTVEYEGPFDGTVRLFRSTERARQRLEKS